MGFSLIPTKEAIPCHRGLPALSSLCPSQSSHHSAFRVPSNMLCALEGLLLQVAEHFSQPGSDDQPWRHPRKLPESCRWPEAGISAGISASQGAPKPLHRIHRLSQTPSVCGAQPGLLMVTIPWGHESLWSGDSGWVVPAWLWAAGAQGGKRAAAVAL